MGRVLKSNIYSYLIAIMVSIYLFSGYLGGVLGLERTITNIIVYICCFFASVLCVLDARLNFLSNFSIALAFLTLLIILELTVAPLRFISYYNTDKITMLLVILFFSFYIGSYYAKNLMRLEQFSTVISYLALITVILLLYQLGGSIGTNDSRLGLGEANPIWIARLAGIPATYSFLRIFLNRGSPLFNYSIFLLSIVCIFLTGSRGPLIALILSIVIYILLTTPNFIRLLFYLIGYAILFILIISLLPPTISERFTSVASGNISESDYSRIYLWDLAISLFLEQPLGRGLGSFSLYSYFPYPHNFFLEVAVELGLFLLILTSLFIIYGLYKGYKYLRKDNPFSIQFITLIMTSSFLNSLFSGDLTSPKDFYLVLTIIVLSRLTQTYKKTRYNY